jgi:hypothetical protein
MSWIGVITYEGQSGIEKKNISAITITRLYTLLYKELFNKIIEIHIFQGEKQ